MQYTWAQLHALYRLTVPAAIPNVQPDYNVCPTDPADVVIPNEGARDLVRMRWGLVPYWCNTGEQVAPPRLAAAAIALDRRKSQREGGQWSSSASLEPLEARRPRLLIADRPAWNDAMQSQQEGEV